MPICSCRDCNFKLVSRSTMARHWDRPRSATRIAMDFGEEPDGPEEDLQQSISQTIMNRWRPQHRRFWLPPTRTKAIMDMARDRRYLRRTQRATKFEEIDADLLERTRRGLDVNLVAK